MAAQLHEIVGRERELALIRAFFAAAEAAPRALILEGEAGIGKTTLWEAAVREAERAGFRIIWCRPAGAEVRLSFSALADLLDRDVDEVLPSLPSPQRRALEMALLRSEQGFAQLSERAVSAGVLGAIRGLAGEMPVAIAIDDTQWLDAPSAEAIAYAARRLGTANVAFVISSRLGETPIVPIGLDRALPARNVTLVEVGPLSLGAVHRLLRERTGHSFSRPTLLRIHDTSGGNPFYAIELARAAGEAGLGTPGEPMQLSRSLDELLGRRLAAIPSRSKDALFIAAAVSQPTVVLLEAALGEPAADLLAPAIDAGIVLVERGAIRFTHPLMASAAYAHGSRDPWRWHVRLAEISTDIEEQARHRSLAVRGPDEEVAALLVMAARRARSRGAPTVAAELYESAIARTPPDLTHERSVRTVEGAPALIKVGERQKARSLLDSVVDSTPAGPLRADALILLADLVEDDPDGERRKRATLQQASLEAGDDPRLHAQALLRLEMLERHSERLSSALGYARQALALAEQSGDEALLTNALTRTADLEVVLGSGTDPVDRFSRALALDERVHIDPAMGPASMLAACLIRAGRLDEARPLLLRQRQRTYDEGDESTRDVLCMFLCELEWLAGNWDAAHAAAMEGLEVTEQAGARVMAGAMSALIALVDGSRGHIEPAIERAREAARQCDAIGEYSYALYNRQVIGFLELSRGNYGLAHEHLAGYSLERGIEGTKRISFIGDEIEALIRLGELKAAAGLVEELEKRGDLLHRPTLTAVAARCRAQLGVARGDSEAAEVNLAQAIETFTALRMPFDRARSLLILGEVRRRAKQKRAAREALQEALAAFESLGAAVWAGRSRQELGRIGGRTMSGGLTATERRVAELVALGRTNKEVASELFVGVRAVEANLSRIYAKLQVGSRTELASHLRRATGKEPGEAPGSAESVP